MPRKQGCRLIGGRRIKSAVVVRASSSAASTSSPWSLGSLILYERKDGRVGLGLVEELQGKKNAFVLDAQSGRQVSILPKQVVSTLVGGGPYRPADLMAFAHAAAKVADEEADADHTKPVPLADAWELAVADGVSAWTLGDLADLVLGDMSSKNLYLMYCMLSSDKLYFRAGKRDAGGDLAKFMYSPNSEEVVQQKLKELQEEQVVEAARASWAEAVKSTLAISKRSQQPSREKWLQGPFAHRVRALEVTALSGDTLKVPPKELELARESLSLVGINPPSANPQAATSGPSLGSPLADKCSDLLVDMRVLRAHEPLRVIRRGLPLEFSEKLEEAAKVLLDSCPEDNCASSRIDLTHLRCYTIDNASTTEVDDGISVTTLDGEDLLEDNSNLKQTVSGVRIWVHVADPTRWLAGAPGSSELLEEAAARGRSMYFPWGSVPMFPKSLATGPFSLREGKVCEALSVSCALDDDGSISDVQVHPSRITITHKVTYHDADVLMAAADALEGADGAARQGQAASEPGKGGNMGDASSRSEGVASSSGRGELGVLLDMRVLGLATKARRAYRTAGNCIEIPLPEADVLVPMEDMDSFYPRVSITRLSQWESGSRLMVAEMMILAGEGVGKLGSRLGLPLPYRAQPQPALPVKAIQESAPEGVCRGYMFRRCMTRSTVAPSPSRHASLGIDAYVQLTSPIRRYMDIVTHMNIKAHISGSPLPFSASAIERLAAPTSKRAKSMSGAERAEEAYWVAEYFRQRKKEGANTEWPATVLGWQQQDLKLAAVLLDEVGLEVVIKVSMDVNPGDYLVVGLLEAQPAEGLLRFYVTDYLLSGGGLAQAASKLLAEGAANDPLLDDSLWPSAMIADDGEGSEANAGAASVDDSSTTSGAPPEAVGVSGGVGLAGPASLDGNVVNWELSPNSNAFVPPP